MINAVKNKERGYHKPGARVATLFINVLDLGYRLSKDEIYEIIDDIFEKVSDDEDYENNIDSIIEEVFKDHGITDEDNLDFA